MVDQLFIDIINRHGLYRTPERVRLFQELVRQKKPCTIEELVSLTSDMLNRSTVYRNLDLFESLGITTRVYNGWKYRIELSDQFSPHHHHMTCTNCGQIVAFEESQTFLSELHALESKYGFKAQSHSLELKGLCQNCY